MNTRTLGDSGLKVSGIGFGAMGMSFGLSPAGEKGEMIKVLRAAVERGYTFFDTAEIYGPYVNCYSDPDQFVATARRLYSDAI